MRPPEQNTRHRSAEPSQTDQAKARPSYPRRPSRMAPTPHGFFVILQLGQRTWVLEGAWAWSEALDVGMRKATTSQIVAARKTER